MSNRASRKIAAAAIVTAAADAKYLATIERALAKAAKYAY